MYNIAVCDDDVNHVIMAELLIEDILNEERVVGDIKTFTNPDQLVEDVNKDPKIFDVIFLDIEMPEKSGLEIGQVIRKINQDVLLIYITSYEKYSLSAYDNRPFHYLMKPIDKIKFKEVLIDAINYIDGNSSLSDSNSNKLLFTVNKSIISIEYRNILYIAKSRNTCEITCKNKIYTIYDTLNNIEMKLNDNFYRCHQSYIVNLMNVYQYGNGNYIMRDGKEIPISRVNRKEAKKIFVKALRGMSE